MSQGFKSQGKRRQHPHPAAAPRLEGAFSLGKMRKGQPKDTNPWVGLGLGFAHAALQSASPCPAPVAPGTMTRRALPCQPQLHPTVASAKGNPGARGAGPAITLQSNYTSPPFLEEIVQIPECLIPVRTVGVAFSCGSR